MKHTLRLAVAAALGLALMAPSAASAQFGGLKKKIKSAVSQSAGEEATAAVVPAAPAPAFDERTIEMTGPRLDAVLKAAPKMKDFYAKWQADNTPEMQEKRRKDYDAAEAKYQKYDDCRDKARSSQGLGSEKLSKRLEVLASQGAMTEVSRIMDSVQKAAPKTEAEAIKRDSMLVTSKCGAEVKEPKQSGSGANLNATFAGFTGMTEEQWAEMKERLMTVMAFAKRRFESERASGISETETKAILERYEPLKALSREDWFGAY